MVPLTRIERTTSPLPRECSTTELQGHFLDGTCEKRPHQASYKKDPMKLTRHPRFTRALRLERVKGIEPSS